MPDISNAERLRNLKHELRTPVNHILGYSELLLEVATDAGDTEIQHRARSINAHSRNLARLVEHNLRNSLRDNGELEMNVMSKGLRPVINQIRDITLPESGCVKIYTDDLQKIRKALSQLESLVSAV